MSLSETILKFNPVKSVKVPVKLTISALLALLLVAFLQIQLTGITNDSIRFRALELQGTQYIPTLYKILSHTQGTRGLTNSKLNGTAGLDENITNNRNSALEFYDQLDDLLDEYGELGSVRADAKSLRQQFESLNSRAFNGPARDVFGQYTQIITGIRDLIVKVGDQSNLTLDPDLDTFYLMDYMVFKAHVTGEAYGKLRGQGAGFIANNRFDPTALIGFARIVGEANSSATVGSLQSAVDFNDAIKVDLNSLISELKNAEETFETQVFNIVENQRATVSSSEYFSMGTAAISRMYKGVEEVNAVMQRLLSERIGELKTKRNTSVVIAVLIGLITIWVFLVTILSIVNSLNRTKSVLASVASGDLSQILEVDTKDEFLELANSLNETQGILKSNIDSERAIAEESDRLKNALTVADTPVMLADTDMNIIYVNQAAQKLMDHRAKELKSVLPAFNNQQLVGSNVDAFHKDPSHQRRLLGSLTETYRSQIKVAGLTFNLTATPLFGESGDRLGTVIEWGDVTEELAKSEELQRIAQENARIRQALDNVTTNTMIADSERNIVYINKSVHKMLKGRERALQAVLPNFNADKLIGETMDVFHKNPAHQRDLLAAMKETYRAQIQVADLHFGLTANPVYDEDGNRIGSVVEWQDMTEEVNIRTEIDNLIKSASHGDLTQRIPLEGKSGFFANLSEGLNQLVQISEGVVADTARVFSALSHGDLTETIEQHYEGAFGELKNDANATVNKLTEIITQIREAAGTVSTGADEIAQGNTDLSQRTEEQASSLEETASSMEEMTSAVKSSADNAMQANDIAQQTQKLASSGGSVVQDAVRAMGEINESSKHIADIIGVIDEIAFQTNLLALNAAVEAARAGEQGRGFAVVASEVRNLAQRSAAAAKEIKDLIRDSVDKVTTGSGLVNKSGETLEEIVASVQKVSSMVEDISGSAHEQSSGIEQVNKAVSQMDEMTQQNAALVEEASAAGEAMAEQARKLMQQMAFFTLANDGMKRSSMTTSTSALAAKAAPVVSSKPAPAAPLPENTKPVSSQGGMEVSDDDDDWEEF